MIFAKLFQHGDEQVLVTLEYEDEEDSLTLVITCQPPGYGICRIRATSNKGKSAHDERQRMFDAIDEKQAWELTLAMYHTVGLEPPRQPPAGE